MKKGGVIIAGIGIVLAAVVLITLALTPEGTNPVSAAAVTFANAAGKGDEATAFALLSPELAAYTRASCPDGRVTACIDGYIPDAWGDLVSALYRRAAPVGAEWDIDLIATYARDIGASGVCTTLHMAQDEAGAWRVTRWAGWVWCGDPASRDMEANPDAPNRAP